MARVALDIPGADGFDYGMAPEQAQRVREGSWVLVPWGKDRRIGLVVELRPDSPVPESKLRTREAFGPVLAVIPYDDFDEALAIANETPFGLQAGLFTNDLDKALRAVRELRFGGVLVNDVPTYRADQQPYGGVGDSGNTREGPASRRRPHSPVQPRHRLLPVHPGRGRRRV